MVKEPCWLVGIGGCWDRPDMGSLTGRFTEESILTAFLASWSLSIFSLLFSSMSHCVRKASRNQEKAPLPLRTRDLTYPYHPSHRSNDHLEQPSLKLV